MCPFREPTNGVRALPVTNDLQGRMADESMRTAIPCGIRARRVASDLCGVALSTPFCAGARIGRRLQNTHRKGSHGRQVAYTKDLIFVQPLGLAHRSWHLYS